MAASALPRPISLVEKFAATLAIGAMQIVLVTTLTGALGILYQATVALFSISISTALIVVFRKRVGWNAVISEVASAWQKLLEKRTLLAVIPGACAFLLVYLYAASRPPMGFDSIYYHLTLAAHAIQNHNFSITFFPPYFDMFAYFPENGEMFSLWMMLWCGGDFLLPYINIPFLLLLAASIYALARRGGLGRASGLALTSMLLTTPVIFMIVTEAYVELPFWAFFVSALLFGILSVERQSTVLFMLAVGLASLMAGTKTLGIPIFVLLLLFIISFDALHNRKHSARGILKKLGISMLGFLLLGSVFYIRNWIVTGNPLFPYPIHIFGVQVFRGEQGLDRLLFRTSLLPFLGFLWDIGRLQDALIGQVGTVRSGWGLGPSGVSALFLGVTLGPLAFIDLLRKRKRSNTKLEALFFVFVLLLVAEYIIMPYGAKFLYFNVRFLYPAVVLSALAAGSLMKRFGFSDNVILSGALFLQVVTFFFSQISITKDTGMLVAAGSASLVLFIVLARYLRSRNLLTSNGPDKAPMSRKVLQIIAVVLLVLYGTTLLHHWREAHRIQSYQKANNPSQLILSTFVNCLEAVDQYLPAGRLAVAINERRDAFLFPLFGPRLNRRVFYVNIGKSDSRIHSDYAFGNPRAHPDENAWLRHMAKARPDAVFVFLDPDAKVQTIEDSWARSMPHVFSPLYKSKRCELFKVDSHALVNNLVRDFGHDLH